MLRVENKYNYPILIILLVWLFFAIYTFCQHNLNDIHGLIHTGIILITVIIFPICATLIMITNLICKRKYNSDINFITVPFITIVIILLFFASIRN